MAPSIGSIALANDLAVPPPAPQNDPPDDEEPDEAAPAPATATDNSALREGFFWFLNIGYDARVPDPVLTRLFGIFSNLVLPRVSQYLWTPFFAAIHLERSLLSHRRYTRQWASASDVSSCI